MQDSSVFILNRNGCVSGWNPAMERLTGVTAAIAIDRPFSAFFPPEDIAADRPADFLRRARIEGACEAHGRYLKGDGIPCRAAIRVEAQFDRSGELQGYSVSAQGFEEDSADLKPEPELELERQKHFADSMMESMPGILYLYDTDGRFLRWNRNFETVSGYPHDEIARMHPLDFFSPEEKPRMKERIAEVFRIGESSIEASFLAKDGSSTRYFFTGRLVDFGGSPCLVGVGIDVSERARAQVELAESERKYRDLVQNANSIILRWNSEGVITLLNEFGLKFFGYGAEEIIGRHVIGTIVPLTESGGRDLRPLMEQICADPKAFEQNVNENIRRNGDRVWIAWTNRIALDSNGQVEEILSIGSDITVQKLAEQARAESEARYRKLFEYAPDGILIADGRSRYLDANESICRMLGYTREELIGKEATDIIDPGEAPQIEPAIDSIKNQAEHLREWRFRRKDGTTFQADVMATMMPDGNLMGMVRDVTERKQAQEERQRRERAEAADHIKSAFLATMSHELRTPLNSIIGFTGIMLQGLAGPLNPEQDKQLGMVRSSARHLLALVNDVLDISKIEAGQLEVDRVAFDLRGSLDKAAALIGPQAEAKGLRLRLRAASGLGEAVGDARRFEQILLNLLTNAVKFTDHGEITLAAEWVGDYLPSGAVQSVRALRIEVADTGTGIRSEDLPTLFQPFRQVDSGLSRQHEGSGLGLAICRRLAGLMGGSIGVSSEWGKGSTFTVTLPLPLKGGTET
ncbi:MAG: PAS domain S-box protein [Fibrobacteria bacterium]